MKILITGSSGFVGRHLVKKLSSGYQIVKYDLVNGQDILNEKLLLGKLKNVDIVIHLAAFISAEESWSKPKEYFVNNALGTLSVVQNSIKAGVKKIIYFSSAAVKAKPLTPYALSKITGENFIKLYSKDIKTVIVRPENIYGPGQKQSYGYVIHNFIKAVKSGQNIKIYGTGKQIRDFIYIDDVINVVAKLVDLELKSGIVISLGTGIGTEIIELAKTVSSIIDQKFKMDFRPARLEPLRSIGDATLLRKLGLDPNSFIDLRTGVRKLIKLKYS